MVCNLDAYYPKDYHQSHNIAFKVQTQSFNNKDLSRFEKPRNKNMKQALLFGNIIEPANKKNKKKYSEAVGKSKINKLRLLVLTPKLQKRKKKKRSSSEIISFNYNKKCHYSSNYTKPKNLHWSP